VPSKGSLAMIKASLQLKKQLLLLPEILSHNFKKNINNKRTYNPDMKTLTLILLLASIYAVTAESHLARVDAAYKALCSDFNGMRDLYDEDAILAFCWGSGKLACVEGSVNEVLLPFHQALKMFKVKTQALTGENGPVMSLHWNNYQETPDGCGQVATGIAVFEFNNEDKVICHYSLSHTDIVCVPNYLQSVKVE
jgi:hypothetical protein